MKILFSGGGTLGPVTPLLAIHEILARAFSAPEFLWAGTHDGPERALVEARGIPFVTMASGKVRRYASLWNIIDIFCLLAGFLQALLLLAEEKPDLCISAGGFVSVPIHMAARILGIPAWVHQQDARIGLANRFMAKIAAVVTTSLRAQAEKFPSGRARHLGNPVRSDILAGSGGRAREIFGLSGTLPVVFATGGGTGSARVNELVAGAAGHLEGAAEIIHLIGSDRSKEDVERAAKLYPFYHVYRFFAEEMADAYAVADIVVARAGFGTIAEAAALRKPLVLIPKEGHQEKNARFLAEAGAAVVLNQDSASGNHLARALKDLLANPARCAAMGERLHSLLPAASENSIIAIARELLKKD